MIIGDKGILKSIKDVIGKLTDVVSVPFVMGTNTIIGFLQTGYFHVHGASFIYPKYVLPIQLTSNAAAWNTTGLLFEIIPTNGIIKNFDLHWASISDISANLYGIVDIYSGLSGAEVLIGSVDVSRTNNFSQEGQKPVQIPQQPANTRISAKFSDSTSSAQTCRVKFYGHVYETSL
jgi:hypothetical protein